MKKKNRRRLLMLIIVMALLNIYVICTQDLDNRILPQMSWMSF